MTSKVKVSLTVLILAIIWITSSTQAFNPQPDPPGKWGMIGITPYETGRINVVANQVVQSCVIGLGFMDAQGRVLKSEFKMLRSGFAQNLDLMGIDAVTRGELRAEIQPFLADPPTGRNYPPGPWCEDVMATFEVFDNATGQTSLLVPAVQRTGKGK